MSETSERTFYIYCHTAPNGKRYIGQTCQKPEARWRDGHGYRGCIHLTRAIDKYGWDNFRHDILCVVHSLEVANLFERHYISKFRSNESNYGYNMTCGGSEGYAFRDDVREKISKKAKERGISPENIAKMREGRARHGWRRRPMTDEEKKAASERMKGSNHPFYGRKMPKEWVEKRAEKIRGRKASEETRKNQSIGLRNSEKVKAKQIPVLQYDKDGNLVKRHDGLSAAARDIGVSKQGIRSVCIGNSDTAYGYHWEYDNAELQKKAAETRRARKDTSTIGLPVVQISLSGEVVARFKSTVDASKQTGFPRYAITNCCRGRLSTSHGYKWQYDKQAA